MTPPRLRPVVLRADLRTFCGYCGRGAREGATRSSRVCPVCSLGLLLEAPADVAPGPGGAFLVVDELLRIRAVSRAAEPLLHHSEQSLVGRQVGEVLTSADVAPAGAATLSALIGRAIRDETSRTAATVRPRGAYGVRFGVSIAGCRPGPAALLVFDASL